MFCHLPCVLLSSSPLSQSRKCNYRAKAVVQVLCPAHTCLRCHKAEGSSASNDGLSDCREEGFPSETSGNISVCAPSQPPLHYASGSLSSCCSHIPGCSPLGTFPVPFLSLNGVLEWRQTENCRFKDERNSLVLPHPLKKYKSLKR